MKCVRYKSEFHRTCLAPAGLGVAVRTRSPSHRGRKGTLRISKGTGAYLAREVAELALLIAVLAIVGSFTRIPNWVLVGFPVAKAFTSMAFYLLLLRRTLRRPVCDGAEDLIGRTVKASTALNPDGQIKVDGEIWSARSADGCTIAPSDDVEIVDVRGNVVLVARLAIEE